MGYDIAMQLDIAAEPAVLDAALTTTEGTAGWWTPRSQTTAVVGETARYEFPGTPVVWDMKVTEAVPGRSLAWHCTGGPPPWIGTQVRWTLSPGAAGGTLLVLEHDGFAAKDEVFRRVTMIWAEMLLRLKDYAEAGTVAPYFAF
jgi:uncharacterized protein YndB with AHSA1/START domain